MSTGEMATSRVSSDVRRHNLGLIAQDLIEKGPRSRSQIADDTGLTRGAVTALTTALIRGGVLRESADAAPVAKGRPRTMLELAADHTAIVAIQLDADKATAIATTIAGDQLLRIDEQHGRPLAQSDIVIDVLAKVLRRALDRIEALGRTASATVVVVFAPVGGNPAIVLADTDLDWGAVDLLAELRVREPRLSRDAVLSSDAPLAAQAELRLLPGIKELLYLKSNSGIGGALILRGQLVTGSQNLAGELGHVAIVPDGEVCLCGQRGCLVTVAGPDVVLASAGLSPLMQSAGLSTALTEFVRRVHAGDKRSVAAWQGASIWIARTLDILTLAFDPAVIVLGGYWAELTSSVEANYLRPGPAIALRGVWSRPRIVPGALGADAALFGAMWSARDDLLRDPLGLAWPVQPRA